MNEAETMTQPSQASELVGILPPTAPPPLPHRRIGFLRAFFLFWIVPKRLGPHIMAQSIRRAFTAHLFSLAVASFAAVVAFLIMPGVLSGGKFSMPIGLSTLEALRWLLAGTVLELAAESTNASIGSGMVATICIGALPLFELAMVLLALPLMPYAAAGDKASSVFARSLKTVYWASTILLPLAIITVSASYCCIASDVVQAANAEGIILIVSWILGFIIILFGLRAAFVAGHQYVGPADGPAFAEREPRCETCGYILFGLPIDARCPECGTAVGDSLPGGRRKPTLWQEQGIRLRGIFDLIRLHAAVLFSVAPLTRIPVHSALKAARHFWWASFVMMVLVLLALLRLAAVFDESARGLQLQMGPLSLPIIILPFLLQAVLTLAACLWTQFRHGIRDYRVSAIICFYASPLQWPLLIVLLAVICIRSSGYSAELRGMDLGAFAGIQIDGLMLVTALGGLFTLACIGFWFRRLLAALWAARFANV